MLVSNIKTCYKPEHQKYFDETDPDFVRDFESEDARNTFLYNATCSCIGSKMIRCMDDLRTYVKTYQNSYNATKLEDCFKKLKDYIRKHFTEDDVINMIIINGHSSSFRQYCPGFATNTNCIIAALNASSVIGIESFQFITDNPSILSDVRLEVIKNYSKIAWISLPNGARYDQIVSLLNHFRSDSERLHEFFKACMKTYRETLYEVLLNIDFVKVDIVLEYSKQYTDSLIKLGYKSKTPTKSKKPVRKKLKKTSRISTITYDYHSPISGSRTPFQLINAITNMYIAFEDENFIADTAKHISNNIEDEIDLAPVMYIIKKFSNRNKNIMVSISPKIINDIGKFEITNMACVGADPFEFYDFRKVPRKRLVSIVRNNIRFCDSHPGIIDEEMVAEFVQNNPKFLKYSKNQQTYKDVILKHIKNGKAIHGLEYIDEDILNMYVQYNTKNIGDCREYIKNNGRLAVQLARINSYYIEYFDDRIQEIIRSKGIEDAKFHFTRQKSARK